MIVRLVEDLDETGDHQAKAALFDALAETAGALGAGRRAEIIDQLVKARPDKPTSP
ncbi:MAG: hypothetical protein ACP5P1_13920 [Acidimicrobiales bacterium]